MNVVNQPLKVEIVSPIPLPTAPTATEVDYVSVRLSGSFPKDSCCLTDDGTTFIPQVNVGGEFGGRDLLLEYVSCQALVNSTDPVNLYIGINGQDAPFDTLIAVELSEQHKALSADSIFGTAWQASHPVKVLVDSSDNLLLVGRKGGNTDVKSGLASCILAGQLVN